MCASQLKWSLFAIALTVALFCVNGCGGGSAASLGAGPPGGSLPPSRTAATARVHIDVGSGRVTFSPLSSTTKAIFSGTALGFNSSTLLAEFGDAARKAVSISITNHSAETVGQLPSGSVTGLQVQFSQITNVSQAATNLSAGSRVLTIAGTGVYGGTDGPALSSKVAAPGATAVAPDGVVYIIGGDNLIRQIAGGQLSTLAGGGSDTTNGIGATAGFSGTSGIAYNPADESLVVCEYYGSRIRRVTRQGRVSLIAGSGSAGETDGTGASATFTTPQGVVVDSAGNIYVADSQRVRKITYTGTDRTNAASYTVATLAGSSYGSADGQGTAAKFGGLSGITVDPQGNLYVTDNPLCRIRRIDPAGSVTTIAGTSAGNADGLGSIAAFSAPVGIAYAQGGVFVSDSGNNKMRVIVPVQGASQANANGWNVATVAGTGASGSADGPGNSATFNTPYLMSADSSGNLYTCDYSANIVRRITPPNGFMQIAQGNLGSSTDPVALYNSDGVQPSQTEGGNLPYLNYPGSIAPGATSQPRNWVFEVPATVAAFDFTVTVEAADSFGAPVTGIATSGAALSTVRTLAGTGTPGGFLDGAAAQSRFNSQLSAAVDASGNIFLTDTFNHAIRRVSAMGVVSTVAGVAPATSGSGDGLGTVARFFGPNGVAVTPDGSTLYVADQINHRIRRILLSSGTDPTNAANWGVTTIAGSTAGYAEGNGSTAQFNAPFAIALDATGANLYIAERVGNRIRRLQYLGGDAGNPASWASSLVAGDSSGSVGAAGSTNGTGSAARFSSPEGVAVAPGGAVLVADANNNEIRKITPSGVVTTLAGSTATGLIDGTGAAARFSFPTGISCDNAGYAYVGDFNNYAIRRVSPSAVVTTVAGTGSSGHIDGLASAAQFGGPLSTALSSGGDLVVGDGGSVRSVERVVGYGP